MTQNLTQYKIFYFTAKNGSISRAANELYISQPAISKAIKKLEESLNTSLLHRSSRGVTLTDDGELLYQQLSVAFEAIDYGESLLTERAKLGVGHITIGVSTTLCKYILIPYLKKFIRKFPHIQISIECQSTAKSLEMLQQNKLDVGLIGSSDIIESDFFYYIRDIQYIFVSTKQYMENLKLRGIESVRGYFEKGNIILQDKENLSRQFIDHYFDKQHLLVANPLEVSNMDLIVDFAKIGLGIGCVIKEFVEKELGSETLIQVTLPSPIPARKIGFLFNKSKQYSQPVKNFIELL